MRLPSIDELRKHAAAAFRRFPYTISAGLASAFLVIAEAEGFSDVFRFFTRSDAGIDLLVATTLALPLFFALRLAQDRGLLSGLAASALRLLGAVALIAFVWQWPGWSEKLRFLHYVQLSLGLHALAAVVPFVRGGELNGFWQYNRALFLRFLIGVLYSVVLFGGLAIALLAIENLFALDVHEELYMDLWGIVAFGFQTWFFTAGVPENLGALDEVEDYPKGLKLFSQYVLIPLVTVYLLILTAYLARILITTEWPSGWIGWLVSCVSVAGILSILLTHPIRHRRENAWIVTYGRWFWLVMIPSIAMLLMAVWKRIDQYGITEPRYFLLVLTLWLAAMAVVYGIVRSQNIKWLPATLCVLAFVTFLGPWSAYSVSRSSQLSRLEGLLERNGMLVEGRAVTRDEAAPGDTVPTDERREIGAAMTYLFAHHGSEPLVGLLGPELAVTDSAGGTDPVREWEARDRADEVMAELDLEFVDARPRVDPGGHFNLRVDTGEAVDISGYRYVLEAGQNRTATIGDRELSFEMVDEASLAVRFGETTLLTFPLEELVATALDEEGPVGSGPGNLLSRDLMRVEVSGPSASGVYLPGWISGRQRGERIEVNGTSGLLLLDVTEASFMAPADTAAGADTAATADTAAAANPRPAGSVP